MEGHRAGAVAAAALDRLSKRYGATLAVDGVSFEVRHREVLGLLGPNGSGKTTILRVLTGYLRPSAGSAQAGGFDLVREGRSARGRVGYVPEDAPLYRHMRVSEFLVFMGRLRGLAGERLHDRLEFVRERLALDDVFSNIIGRLSRGYRQRVAIAQAILHEPELLVLDEPTNGLDPRQIIELRGLMRGLTAHCSVIVTSHILSEIERVADRVAILLNGRLLAVVGMAEIAAAGSDLERTFLQLTTETGERLTVLRALIVKEVGALFVSPVAYAVIAVFLLLSGYSFAITLIVAKQASLVPLFFQAAVQFVLLVPILTMRLFAEERRTGTLELLLTSPAREIDIVLAKFAAAMTVLLAMIGLTLTYALVIGIYGDPDWGPVYSGYLGLVLLAGALVALGLALSALTANQIVAAVVALGVFGILWSIDSLASLLPSPMENWFLGLSLLARFTPFATGAMYTSDFGFFLALILLGLFLTVRALARR